MRMRMRARALTLVHEHVVLSQLEAMVGGVDEVGGIYDSQVSARRHHVVNQVIDRHQHAPSVPEDTRDHLSYN